MQRPEPEADRIECSTHLQHAEKAAELLLRSRRHPDDNALQAFAERLDGVCDAALSQYSDERALVHAIERLSHDWLVFTDSADGELSADELHRRNIVYNSLLAARDAMRRSGRL